VDRCFVALDWVKNTRLVLHWCNTTGVKIQAFENSSWERISFSGKAIGDKYGSCKNTNDKYD